MNQNSEKIEALFCYCFNNKADKYNLSNILNFDFYLDKGIIIKQIENELDEFSVNFDSELLNEEFLKIAEKENESTLPFQIEYALSFVDKFESNIKIKYQIIESSNDFVKLKKHFRAFIINKFDYSLIEKHYSDILKDKRIDRKKRYDFIDAFFKYLEVYNSNEESILNSCLKYNKSEKYHSNYVFNILGNIAKSNHLVSEKIVNYILDKKFNDYKDFLPVLLINLYNTNYAKAFDIALNCIKRDQIIALKALCGFNFTNSNLINQVFDELQQLGFKSTDDVNLKSQLLCNFISNKNTDATLRRKFFAEIVELLKSENHDFSNAVFSNVKYNLDDFETEKYNLLNIYLNNTKNFYVLKDFFYEFKNPVFLFRILTSSYDITGFRGSIDIFENAISHFYDVSKKQFEDELLNLFNYRKYSFLALKIILSDRSIKLNIDLNELDKQAQINLIDSVCSFPHSIDKLTPMLLTIRNSKFNESRKYLKEKLSELIFEVYHESLFDLIKKNLNDDKKDKAFLEPLQKSLDAYTEIKILKKSIKDLDPTENERNLMELYYRLEHENQAKMMKDVNNDNNSFLSMTKTMVIVRGRSFKSEDSDTVTPLGLIESSLMIDNRAYKNPNNFEQNLENF